MQGTADADCFGRTSGTDGTDSAVMARGRQLNQGFPLYVCSGGDVVFVVFLKNGLLFIVECRLEETFALANVHDAGICGTFPTKRAAEEFVAHADRPPRVAGRWRGFPT